MTSHILVIDQGTTSTRAIVFDAALKPVASAQEEFPQIFPQPGWVEHNPETLWATALGTARAAEVDYQEGAFSSLALVLCGIITSLLAPFIFPLLMHAFG